MRTRISRKALSAYPSRIAAKIKLVAEQFNFITFEQRDELPTKVFRVNDNAYFAMDKDGTSIDKSVQIDDSFTMPPGTWLIEVDGYGLTLYRILEDEKEIKRLERDQALPLDNIRMTLGHGFK